MFTELIREYYEKKGYRWPTQWEAMAWAVTEMAEAYEQLLAETSGWVRANPGAHPTEFNLADFELELAHAIMMLQVAGMKVGADPINRLEMMLKYEH